MYYLSLPVLHLDKTQQNTYLEVMVRFLICIGGQALDSIQDQISGHYYYYYFGSHSFSFKKSIILRHNLYTIKCLQVNLC